MQEQLAETFLTVRRAFRASERQPERAIGAAGPQGKHCSYLLHFLRPWRSDGGGTTPGMEEIE